MIKEMIKKVVCMVAFLVIGLATDYMPVIDINTERLLSGIKTGCILIAVAISLLVLFDIRTIMFQNKSINLEHKDNE